MVTQQSEEKVARGGICQSRRIINTLGLSPPHKACWHNEPFLIRLIFFKKKRPKIFISTKIFHVSPGILLFGVRWCHGLIFHQAAIDCTRATMLLPLAFSLHFCRPIYQCNIFETVFLLLATVSAVNLLTTVLNDTPLMPDDDGIDMDWLVESPQVNHWPGSDNKVNISHINQLLTIRIR